MEAGAHRDGCSRFRSPERIGARTRALILCTVIVGNRLIFLDIIAEPATGAAGNTRNDGFLGDITALYYLNDRNVKSVCEIPVSLVMRGNRHDRACAVSHHYIVSDKDRDLLAVDGVYCLKSLDLKTGLILDQLCSLKLGLLGALVSVSVDGVHIGNAVLILVDHRMLGSHDHESHAEKRIGTGRIDLKFLIDAVDCEIHKSAGGFADPVNLLLLDSLGILHCVKAFQELVGVFGDLKIPDILGKLDDVGMADVALAALAVLV